MQFSLVLDIIISVLLVLTIAYAVRLNQRLSQLRSDKNELLQLAKTFAEATTRAETGIQNLKISSEALQTEVQKAMTLKEDLSYLVERGGRSADEMVASVRTPSRSTARTPSRPTDSGAGGASRHSDPEARLIEEAIRAASPQNLGSDLDRTSPSSREDRAAMTRRIAGRPTQGGDASDGSTGRALGALATRGLNRGPGRDLDLGRDMASDMASEFDRDLGRRGEEDAIEGSKAARDLLKALGAVK